MALLDRQLSMLLPKGGVVTVMYEAFFDESGCDDYSRVLVIGGYIFHSEQALRLEYVWKTLLQKYDLDFFHTVDCAHGNEQFKGLTSQKRGAIQAEFIGALRSVACLGIACITPVGRQERIWMEDSGLNDPYAFAVDMAVMLAWNEVQKRSPGAKISYYFEKGHDSQPIAARVLARTTSFEPVKSAIASYTFAEKREVCLLQAADLISWQCAKHMKDKVYNNRLPRKDFLELVKGRTITALLLAADAKVFVNTNEDPAAHDPRYDQRCRELFNSGEIKDEALKSWLAMKLEGEDRKKAYEFIESVSPSAPWLRGRNQS